MLDADFVLKYDRSISLLVPLTTEASAWIEDRVSEDRTYFGLALVIEHRYLADLVHGIEAEGLKVELEAR